jgi:hypothetical protein
MNRVLVTRTPSVVAFAYRLHLPLALCRRRGPWNFGSSSPSTTEAKIGSHYGGQPSTLFKGDMYTTTHHRCNNATAHYTHKLGLRQRQLMDPSRQRFRHLLRYWRLPPETNGLYTHVARQDGSWDRRRDVGTPFGEAVASDSFGGGFAPSRKRPGGGRSAARGAGEPNFAEL